MATTWRRGMLAGLLVMSCAGPGVATLDPGGPGDPGGDGAIDAPLDLATDTAHDAAFEVAADVLPDLPLDALADLPADIRPDALADATPDLPDLPPIAATCLDCHRDTARLLADLQADPLPPPPEGVSLGEC